MPIKFASRKHLLAIGLVLLAFPIALFGRLALNRLVEYLPQWSAEIDRFGGWVIGMVIGAAVVVPIFRIYGVIRSRRE